MTIDCHAHVVLADTFGAAGALGPELTDDGFRVGDWLLRGVSYRGTPFMDLERRLEAMAAAGVEHQVLSPNPLTWFHHVDAALAGDYCRVHNDALAALVATAPADVSGLAQLPAQDPVAAAAELERAVGLGLVGGAMGTDVGRPLDDPALDDLWAAAAAIGMPISLHPSPPGIDTPRSPRLNRLDLDLHVGFANDESIAVAELVFGHVLVRHPGLDLLISHGGGATALLAGRWRRAMDRRAVGSGDPDDVDRALRRLWFDDHMGSPTAVAALVAEVGEDHLVTGTNFAGWDDCGSHAPGPDRAVNARRLFRRIP